jgi:lipopolysaccharide biosynthesis glycosyltransferase
MNDSIRIYVGYDPREAAAYHVFCQSVMEKASRPCAFIPLHRPMLQDFDGQRDGTNAFIYSRFLVPYLENYRGWALFVDGDMVVRDDIAKLWDLRSENSFNKAVAVVKHEYKTRQPRKYIGTPMEAQNDDYPRKNWSSVMLWNCGHSANMRLTPEVVRDSPGSFLHRFQWLADEQVGELPAEWNCLVGEQDTSSAALLHYTAGVPGFTHYKNCDAAENWHRSRKRAMHLIGETE